MHLVSAVATLEWKHCLVLSSMWQYFAEVRVREVVVVFSTKLYLKEVVIHVKYKGGREGVQNQSLNISSISGSIITQFVIFQTFQNRSIIFPLTI